MSTVATEREPTHTDAEIQLFLNALTDLSRQYKIGIAGEPVLFTLEDEDVDREYTSDADSNLMY